MSAIPAKAPDGFVEAALEFAQFGLVAKNMLGRYELADRPLQVFTATDVPIASLSSADLVPSSWDYFVLKGEEVVGLVNVHERDGTPAARSMQFIGKDSGLHAALRMAGSAFTDGSEVRIINIPPIASFIWITGLSPTFIDQIDPKSYSEQEFIAELQRRIDSKRLV